jgi:ADP-heptose:LPS heptosyltransferase
MKGNMINIVCYGGIGDLLLNTPVFEALKKQDARRKIVVYCKSKEHRDVFRNNPHIDSLRLNTRWSFIRRKLSRHLKTSPWVISNYGELRPGIFYQKHASKIIADEIFRVPMEQRKVQLYLTKEEDEWALEQLAPYKNPVPIHITSLASANQMWPLEYWEELVASMPEYTFIQLGLPSEQQVRGAIDFRGKTTFRQGVSLIKHSLSFVGIVSSFLHATAAFDTPGVGLYGASTPTVWGHDNNINLYKGLHCAPCIDHIYNSKCPYSSKCMRDISVGEVRAALLKQLERTHSSRLCTI